MEKIKDFIIPYDISILKEEDIPENIIIANIKTKVVKYGRYNPTEDFVNEASEILSITLKDFIKESLRKANKGV